MHIKPRVTFLFAVVFSVFLCREGRAATVFSDLKELDLPMPFCEGITNLEVAPTYFTEIENQLEGTPEYNALIQSYRRKNWDKLTAEISTFRKVFETSPLIEAVDFLELQSELERTDNTDLAQIKKFEARFRKTLILYPKSSLAPVLSASLASFYLKTGSYAKALGLYQTARQEYPFHPSACVFVMGTAESHFLLHDYENAKKGFSQVLQKCDAARLILGARIRLVDVDREQGIERKKVELAYEKIQQNNSHLVSRFHSELLFNLGEIKYEAGNYSSAAFYYHEFSKTSGDYLECQAPLYKRLADLSARKKEKPSIVVGNYLAVSEKFPKHDWGKYSKIHALLLEIKEIQNSEIARRLKIVDEQLSGIKDPKIRTVGNIEKGLALLEVGNEGALDYLSALDGHEDFDLKRGEIGTFIREKTLAGLERSSRSVSDDLTEDRDGQLLSPLENAYSGWFEGSPLAERARNLYRELIVQRSVESLEKKGLKRALEKLDRWKNSTLFSTQKIPANTRTKLGSALTLWWFSDKNRDLKKSGERLVAKSDILLPLISPEYEAILIQAYLSAEKTLELEVALKNLERHRRVASLSAKKDPLMASYVSLIMGRAFRATKQYKKSEEALIQVTQPELKPLRYLEQIKTFSESNQFEKALKIGFKGLEKADESQVKTYLDLMKTAVVSGKKWSYSEEVLKAAQKKALKEQALAPFLTMSARAELEKSNCTLSVQRYEEALKLVPDASDKAESRFYLGKCRFKMKDNKGAIKEWKEVVSQKDDFWSPLAENEIKLLESP